MPAAITDSSGRLARLAPLSGGPERRGCRIFRLNVALSGYVFGATMADLLRTQEIAILKNPAHRLLSRR